MTMLIIRTIHEMRNYRAGLTGKVGCVPTMGALHAGHLSLIGSACRSADHVVVSVFVNPTQFGPGEDFDRYPRTWDSDLDMCREMGVDAIFAPGIDDLYDPRVPSVQIDIPELAGVLEGECRPQFFSGVCRVVVKLLNIIQPHLACFGRKDYQQLLVVSAMVADFAMPVSIVPVPTVREEDGLAMSSRNRYLDQHQRQQALGLIKALRQAKMMVEQSGETDPAAVEEAMRTTMVAHHFDVDYAVIRHPRSLKPVDMIDPGGVTALLAGRLGDIRLIDNMLLGVEEE